jgi:regulator of CtrA degradation
MAGVTDSLEGVEAPVCFAEKMASSEAFGVMFREGMTLVEDAAAYLDGDGRAEAKALPRAESLAYAAESMRLTTRLMQIASWLLLQRAVNQGEMSRAQAASDRHRIRLTVQELASHPELFSRLPEKLKELSTHSLRLQDRIIRLDQMIHAPTGESPRPNGSPVSEQIEKLRNAFSQRS